MNNMGVCQRCGSESGFVKYKEFGGVRPCKIKDVNQAGQEIYRDSMEPYYKDEIDLCYPCYRTVTRNERELEKKVLLDSTANQNAV